VIRITVEETDESVSLVVEGRLSGAWVAELESAAASIRPSVKQKEFAIDLAGVSGMDAAGRSLVGRLRSRGVSLRNLDPLSESLVTMELAEVGAYRV
jgi:hypothetical protein